LRYDAGIGSKIMCKKLLVFSLAFCLGVISLIFINLEKGTSLQNTLPDSTNPDIYQNTQTKSQSLSEYFTAINNFFYSFQNAVAENDKEKVVSLIKFPIKVTLTDKKGKPFEKIINSEAEFLQNYNKIFDEPFKRIISRLETEKFRSEVGSYRSEVWSHKHEIRMKAFDKNGGKEFDIKIIELNNYLTHHIKY